MPLPRSWASRGGVEEAEGTNVRGAGKERGGQDNKAGITVQGALDKRATAGLRRGFVKLYQPVLTVRAAAAAAATDTARRAERG